MSSIRSSVEEHLCWALMAAGADKALVWHDIKSGNNVLGVKVGDSKFTTVINDDTLQSVYQQTLTRIKELKTINDVKQRLKG